MPGNCLMRGLGDKKRKNMLRVDYNEYRFSVKETIRYALEGFLLVCIFSYFFYRSIWAVVFLNPFIYFYIKDKRKKLCIKQKEELSLQFKETLNFVNSGMQAGYSIENAFTEAYRDMMQYYGNNSVMVKELFIIKTGLRNNEALEKLIEDFGNRSGIEDVCDFAGILVIGKQSGGNLERIFYNSISVIEEKMTVKQDIQLLIASKKMESDIMCIIPFFIILYVDFTSRGYFDVLYTTTAGRILMTICFAVYIVAVLLSRRITEIEV